MKRLINQALLILLIAGLTFAAGYGLGHDTARPVRAAEAKAHTVELIKPAKPLWGGGQRSA